MSNQHPQGPQPRLSDPGQPEFRGGRQRPKLPDPFAPDGLRIPSEQTQYLFHLASQPTAWKSAPSAIRFAVWVWAISVIASVAGALILVMLFAIGINATRAGDGFTHAQAVYGVNKAGL